MASKVRRSIAAIVAAALGLTGLLLITAAPTASAAGANPVLIVGGTTAMDWDLHPLRDRLQAQGLQVYTMPLAGFPPGSVGTAQSASAVKSKVASIRSATGAAKVDLVGHSQGANAIRYYVKYLGGVTQTGKLVSVGGINYGQWEALSCSWMWQGCADMLPWSSFISSLNSGDDTPGSPGYFHLFSNDGGPGEKNPLQDGAFNAPVQQFCPTRTVKHEDEMKDAAMAELVADALLGRGLATPC